MIKTHKLDKYRELHRGIMVNSIHLTMGMIHNTLLSINFVIYIYIIHGSHGCLSGQGPNTQSLMSQKNTNILTSNLVVKDEVKILWNR